MVLGLVDREGFAIEASAIQAGTKASSSAGFARSSSSIGVAFAAASIAALTTKRMAGTELTW